MREWFKKWQNVIVWIIAASFIAGIAWWSVAEYISARSRSSEAEVEAVGYVVVGGQIPKDSWSRVSRIELESEYSNFLANYGVGSFDPLFEEPPQKANLLKEMLKERAILLYAKENKLLPAKKEIEAKLEEYVNEIKKNEAFAQYVKQRFGSVETYVDKMLKPSVEKQMILDKVKNKVADISEDEMKKYFEEHFEDIRNRYDSANLDVAWFEKEEDAKKFVSMLSNLTFDQAASQMNLETTPLNNFKRGIFDKEIDEKLFSATPNSVVGPFKLSDLWLVVRVKDVTTIKDFASFALSEFYETERSTLQNEAMEKWYEEYVKNKSIELRIVDEVLSYWDRISEAASQSELVELEKELAKKIFLEDGSVSPEAPDTLKSAYVVLAEKMEDLGDVEENLKGKKQALVRYLYEQYPSLLQVARRMYEIDRKDPQIKYNYFTQLYSAIKPYISIVGAQTLLQSILEIEAGLASIVLDTSVATELRTSACYNLYDLSKELKDATSAKFYLDQLQRLNPNYIDFEAAMKELEEMSQSSSQQK
ncbi:peptidyl-prolyl cis-trans isomerase [Thermotoga caldifontis]|uniref:peptidyl-prolyl cis-trans isomerase n=1 Tax=Thermotoga caldifontis TaxID=1508419 RepID=UPI000596E977|nr:peptidyl-prolyl cis-trans isomerase [Thermotoga caldifontis]